MKYLFFIAFFVSITTFSNDFEIKAPFLERQVGFWKTVFLETSQGETLIHDREEPSIIYIKVSHQDKNHHERIRITKNAIKKVRSILFNVYKKKFKRLNKQEKEYLSKIPMKFRKNFRVRLKSIRYQQGMKEKFKRGLVRSFLYLKRIKEIFKEEGVPEEIAYLPHVESSFNYKAYSRVGAAGIWQFMPKSAEMYGLEINKTFDERLNPLKATRAAAKLLRDNYKILGAWPLAITAYNYGPGGLYRASKKFKTKDIAKIIAHNKQSRFSYASRNFYTSFVAAQEIAGNYKKYFPDLIGDKDSKIVQVKLEESIRISTLLENYQLSAEEFKELNPYIKKNGIKKDHELPSGFVVYLTQQSVEKKNSFFSRMYKHIFG